jgi:hypothetical protein
MPSRRRVVSAACIVLLTLSTAEVATGARLTVISSSVLPTIGCGHSGTATDITAKGVSCAEVKHMFATMATGPGFEGWPCTTNRPKRLVTCRKGAAQISYHVPAYAA